MPTRDSFDCHGSPISITTTIFFGHCLAPGHIMHRPKVECHGGWRCSFRHVFGRPREGVHTLRLPVLDIAVVDLALTIVYAERATYLHWSVLLTNGIIMALSVVSRHLRKESATTIDVKERAQLDADGVTP